MRLEEAREIFAIIDNLEIASGTVCLNIGSSTQRFREVDKPHILAELIRPLENIGIRLVNCDMRAAEGVDLVGDVLDPEHQKKMQEFRSGLVLCCNLLEHLSDPKSFASACGSLVNSGGFLVVSVPFSFPRHDDPIDNMLRPSPEEIHSMFPGWELRAGKIIKSGSFLTDLLNKENGLIILIRSVGAVLLPFLSKGKWIPRAHRLLWLFRPYKISIAVLVRQ